MKSMAKFENQARIAIVGLGTLGCLAAGHVAKFSLKKLTLIDRDIVEKHNLAKQLLYSSTDLSKPKALAASEHLAEINPRCKSLPIVADLTSGNIHILEGHDLILDCTDNLETRFLINDYCRKNKIPWIYSAAAGRIGTAMSILPGGPCLECALGRPSNAETCETLGIMFQAAMITSAYQASEAEKIVSNGKASTDMVRFNLKSNDLLRIKVNFRKGCNACSGKYDYLSGKATTRAVKLCSRNTFQIHGKLSPAKFNAIKKALSRKKGFRDFGQCISFGHLTLFRNGRALVSARDEKHARSLYSRFVGN